MKITKEHMQELGFDVKESKKKGMTMFVAIIKADGRQQGSLFCGKNKKRVLEASEKYLRDSFKGTCLELKFYHKIKLGKVFRPRGSAQPEFTVTYDKIKVID